MATKEDYHLVEVNDIEVSNNFMEIGFIMMGTGNNTYLYVDNVELKKQSNLSNITQTQNDSWLKIMTDKNNLQIKVLINAKLPDNSNLDVFDSLGRKIYTKKLDSGQITISNIFIRNQVYIIKVGDITRKIIF